MSEESRIRVTAIEVSDQYCKDVLVTCVEGGSNYWAAFRNVNRNDELDILDCEVLDREESENTGVEEEWKKITIEDIRRAVALASGRDKEGKRLVGKYYLDMILNDDNDAGSSDCLLQLAIFGEVVYS